MRNPFSDRLAARLGSEIISLTPLGGGCISNAAKITLTDGKELFLKYGLKTPSVYLNEAHGLEELRRSESIHVPRVIHADEECIVLEYLIPRAPSNESVFFELFGRQFAKLHKTVRPLPGFTEDNYIGSSPQINLNPEGRNWAEFFWHKRLHYQMNLLERTRGKVNIPKPLAENLQTACNTLLRDHRPNMSLLHGDLWNGNYFCHNDSPVLIDPAVYYGDREADLAMTKLFGGFRSEFYSAYQEELPLPTGWQERTQLYTLYHVLNHAVIFGGHYVSSAKNIMGEIIRSAS